MKSVFILLLCLACAKLQSQSIAITNQSHPFQVVYAQKASYVGQNKKVAQFDYLPAYSLIRNKGRMVLMHYTGYIFESHGGIIDINQISDRLAKKGSFVRPPITNELHNDLEDIPKIEQQQIRLLYPWNYNTQLSRHKRLPLKWFREKKEDEVQKFVITVMDINERLLLQHVTSEMYHEIDIKDIQIPENIIICRISVPEQNEVSDDIVIAFEQEYQLQSTLPRHYSTTKYQCFIDGLIAINKEEYDLATQLFQLSLDTHHDEILEAAYKELLTNNPKLKLSLEQAQKKKDLGKSAF